MSKIGLYLHRRQLLYLARLIRINPPQESPEMNALVEEVNKAVGFVQRSHENGWDDYNYEPTAVESFPKTVARRTTAKDWSKKNHYKSDPNIL